MWLGLTWADAFGGLSAADEDVDGMTISMGLVATAVEGETIWDRSRVAEGCLCER